MKIWIETKDNENLGDFPTLQKAQSFARKTKLNGYVFKGNKTDFEHWGYYNGKCNDAPHGRENKGENFK